MEVNNNVTNYVNTQTSATAATPANSQTKEAQKQASDTTTTVSEAAVYEPSKGNQVYKPDTQKVKQMLNESYQKTEQFRALVEKLLSRQGTTANQAQGKINNMEELMVPIDEQTRRKAQEAIDEGGYYSVENTSQRLLDFAKAVSGGDPAKIEVLKDAFIKGFKQAENMWGGKLPEISQKTYDAVMKGFDEWEKSAKSSTEPIA